MGVSRQHFYDIKKAYADGGIQALQEKSRRKPNFKNRVAPEIEAEVVRTAEEYPAYRQLRAANEVPQWRRADFPLRGPEYLVAA